jgi:TRAP-type C4-dicarboxylate transport system permease small subunit
VRALRRFDRLCAAVEKGAVVLIFCALVLLLCVNILARSLFQVSFHRIPEVVPALVLWLALIGSTLALRESRHIKIELLRHCPTRLQSGLRRTGSLFGMLVTGILFAAAVAFLINEIRLFGPIGWLSVILPVFFALSFSRFLLRALDGPAPHPPFTGARRP